MQSSGGRVAAQERLAQPEGTIAESPRAFYQSFPGVVPDDAVDVEAGSLLELLDCHLGRGAEGPAQLGRVDDEAELLQARLKVGHALMALTSSYEIHGCSLVAAAANAKGRPSKGRPRETAAF